MSDLRNRVLVQHVENTGLHVRHAMQTFEQDGIHIRGHHVCALSGQCQRAGLANALPGCSDEDGFILKSHGVNPLVQGFARCCVPGMVAF